MTTNTSLLIQKLEGIINANLLNEQFGVEELANSFGVSRSQLHRKLKAATGQSLSAFIREYRLNVAFELLNNEEITASEAAYKVGFGSATYFSKSFKDFFGLAPSEVIRKKNEGEKIVLKQFGNSKTIYSKRLFAGLFIGILVISTIIYFSFGHKSMAINNIPENKSIAVFPFDNRSGNPENLYFTDGVTDAITRQLSHLQDVRVVPRSTIEHYIKDDKSIEQLVDDFNISYILRGSVQRVKNTVRIEVQLTNPISQNQVWANYYDREIDGIFFIQNEIAERVASALKTELTILEVSDQNIGYTKNIEAYDLYLKGVFEYRTYTRKGNQLAIKYLTKAILLDPDFALAHAYLAHSILAQGSMAGSKLRAIDAFAQSFGSNEKALKLAPDLPEALLYKGFYLLYNNWDFQNAGEVYRKAIKNKNPDAFALYSDYLHFIKKHKEAAEIAKELEQKEPFYPNTRMILAHYYEGDIEEAIAFAESRLKILNNYYTLDNYGFVLLNTGEYEQAISVFNMIFKIENFRYPRILGWLGAAYARSGQREKALSILNELKEIKKKTSAGSPCFFIGVIYAALDKDVEALQWLEKAVEDHEMEVPWLITEPQLFDLHKKPIFQELVQNIGFPEWVEN